MEQQQSQQQPQQVYNANPNLNQDHEGLRNLMINYIPTTVDEMQLRQLFERFGPIESVKIVCDRETRQSRGYGFVKYQTAASAQQAITELNGFTILNKRLKVALAAAGNRRQRPFNPVNSNSNGGGNMNYYGGNFAGNFGGYPQAAAPNPYAPNPYAQQMMPMYGQYMMPQGAPQQQQQPPVQQQPSRQ